MDKQQTIEGKLLEMVENCKKEKKKEKTRNCEKLRTSTPPPPLTEPTTKALWQPPPPAFGLTDLVVSIGGGRGSQRCSPSLGSFAFTSSRGLNRPDRASFIFSPGELRVKFLLDCGVHGGRRQPMCDPEGCSTVWGAVGGGGTPTPLRRGGFRFRFRMAVRYWLTSEAASRLAG